MSSSARADRERRHSLIVLPQTKHRPDYRSETDSVAGWLQGIELLLSHPLECYRIWRTVGRRAEQIRALGRVTAWMEATLAEHGIAARISTRLKSIASIYRKMQRRRLELGDVHDIRGVRIIVNNPPTCYQVLELVHQSLEPVPDKFDDYIRHPKGNGYQSLHTVVIDREGKTFEVQIRTIDMHRVAELGSAAHWRYKEHEVTAREPSNGRGMARPVPVKVLPLGVDHDNTG